MDSTQPAMPLDATWQASDAHFAAAAFGDRPGLRLLPVPDGDHQRWLAAVAYGGQGRFARADAELAELARSGPLWRSLAASVGGSLLRQRGLHVRAARLDGKALTLATELAARGQPAGGRGPTWRTQAVCDAWTGLAADALGSGRCTLATRLLDRCEQVLDDPADAQVVDPLWRARLRLRWVRAETALAGGRPAAALAEAHRAREMAHRCGSARHRVKTDLIVAASLCAVGRTEESAEAADTVLAEAEEYGLVPLRWAASMLLAGVRPGRGVRRVRAECEAFMAAHGGELG